jgi:hypothetical protein
MSFHSLPIFKRTDVIYSKDPQVRLGSSLLLCLDAENVSRAFWDLACQTAVRERPDVRVVRLLLTLHCCNIPSNMLSGLVSETRLSATYKELHCIHKSLEVLGLWIYVENLTRTTQEIDVEWPQK